MRWKLKESTCGDRQHVKLRNQETGAKKQVVWILQACHVANKLDLLVLYWSALGLGFFNQKSSMNCFSRLPVSEWLIIQRWAMPSESVYAEWLQEQGERDAWVTETLQWLPPLLCPWQRATGLQRWLRGTEEECYMADGVATGKCYRWVLTTLRAIPCAVYKVCTGSVRACAVCERKPATAVINWFLRD